MVGAAGFEPATFWSQTRRATRLRYAPMGMAFDTRFDSGRQPLAGIENRGSDTIPDCDAKLTCRSADYLQDGPDRPP